MALSAYFEKIKKAEYIRSFKAAAGDEEQLLLAEEGLEEYLKILDEGQDLTKREIQNPLGRDNREPVTGNYKRAQ